MFKGVGTNTTSGVYCFVAQGTLLSNFLDTTNTNWTYFMALSLNCPYFIGNGTLYGPVFVNTASNGALVGV